MKYEIRKEQNGRIVESISVDGEKEAIETAREIVHNGGKYLNYAVYVSFFRESDGQTGFLNPDGNHEPVGRDWNR